VRAELDAYGEGLAEKPEIVALNKADALTPEQLKQQIARLKRRGQENTSGDFGGQRRRRAGGLACLDQGHRRNANRDRPIARARTRLATLTSSEGQSVNL
jgi:GTPase involved in cell partitioning and DNA repair